MGQDPLHKLPEHVERLPFFTLEKNCWVESLVLAPMVFWNFQIFRLSFAPPGRGILTMTRYRFPLQPGDRKPNFWRIWDRTLYSSVVLSGLS